MDKVKNQRVFNVIWFFVMFSFITIASYAQDNNSKSKDEAFKKEAQKLATKLVDKLGLKSDKTDKISSILEDYRKDIADAHKDYLDKKQKNDEKMTGSSSRDKRESASEKKTEAYRDLKGEYKKADDKADKDITDQLDNKTEKDKYMQIKKGWWKDVKNKVYSSLSITRRESNKY
ncbi:MAG: hypothetical protein ACM3P0_13615 [Acidobacteriota bacterium]